MANVQAGAPSIGDLINRGVDYAKSAKAALPYVGLAIASAIVPLLFGQALGGIISLVAAIALAFVGVMACREAITGQFERRDSDMRAVAILIGAAILLVLAVFIVSIPIAFVLGDNRIGAIIYYLILIAAAVAVAARFIFAAPAMAMGDAVSIQSLLAQSAPHWVTLIAIMLVAALPGALFALIFGGAGGVFGFIVQAIGGVIGGVMGLIALGAISRLYASHVRRAA